MDLEREKSSQRRASGYLGRSTPTSSNQETAWTDEGDRPWKSRAEQNALERSRSTLLVGNAGKLPLSEIAKQLSRSEAAMRAKASKLKKDGQDICLRHHESTLVWCPNAQLGAASYSRRAENAAYAGHEIGFKGMKDAASLQSMRYQRKRAQYLMRSRGLGGSLPPKPPFPNLDGRAQYESSMLQEQYNLDIENWETTCLLKKICAAKTRLMRIRKKYDN